MPETETKARTQKAKAEKKPATYFVWREKATKPFRTYRETKNRPIPSGHHNLLWTGENYQSGIQVQRAANSFKTRHGKDHPDQKMLFPQHFASFAG